MAENPEEQVIGLIKAGTRSEVSEIEALFDALKPVSVDQLVGKWKGAYFNIGHPLASGPTVDTWAGKDFHSIDNVDPIVVYDKDGNRKPNPDYGTARLREVKYRGVVSAAMIYDKLPIIDPFRFVTPEIVMGVMDRKGDPDNGTLYFHLTRIR